MVVSFIGGTVVVLYCGGQFYCCSMPLSTIAQLYCGCSIFVVFYATVNNSSVILWWSVLLAERLLFYTVVVQFSWYFMPLSTIAQLYCGGQFYWRTVVLYCGCSIFVVLYATVNNSSVILWWSVLLAERLFYTVVVQFSWYFMPLSTIAQLYCGGQFYWRNGCFILWLFNFRGILCHCQQ